MNNPQTLPIPELKLERYLLGEVSEEEARAIRTTIERDPEVRARVASLEASNDTLLHTHPAGPFLVAVERRLAGSTPPPRTRPVGILALAPLAAAALVAYLLGPWSMRGLFLGSPASVVTLDGDRLKGDGPELLVFVKGSGEKGERLAPGAFARHGDIIQLAYRNASSNFGVIVSVDGRGRATRHFPLLGEKAPPLRAGGIVLIDAAYRLDDAPRAERFFLITSQEPFPIAPVMAAARNSGLDPLVIDRLPVGPNLAQTSFLLKKE